MLWLLKSIFLYILQLPTFNVQHILARSEERLFPGACIKLAIKYNGPQNTLHEDRVKMSLKTGKAKLLIIIPTKVWFSFWSISGEHVEGASTKEALCLFFTVYSFLKEMIVFLHYASVAVCMSKHVNFDTCMFTEFTTVFVDTRLWKTKHSRKRFQNFRQSYVLSTCRIEIHQSQPASMT